MPASGDGRVYQRPLPDDALADGIDESNVTERLNDWVTDPSGSYSFT